MNMKAGGEIGTGLMMSIPDTAIGLDMDGGEDMDTGMMTMNVRLAITQDQDTMKTPTEDGPAMKMIIPDTGDGPEKMKDPGMEEGLDMEDGGLAMMTTNTDTALLTLGTLDRDMETIARTDHVLRSEVILNTDPDQFIDRSMHAQARSAAPTKQHGSSSKKVSTHPGLPRLSPTTTT